MPTQRLFAHCPTFPDNVPVAQLPALSLERISSLDAREGKGLFDACQEYGFFLIDLTDTQLGCHLLQAAETMFELNRTTLNLDDTVLSEYAYNPPQNLLGYKSTGRLRTDDGKVDFMKMYSIGQDDIMGNIEPRRLPNVIEAKREECQCFFKYAHATAMLLLAALERQLGLPSGTLEQLNALDKQSDTSLRLLLSPPQYVPEDNRITLGGHTDIGTLTLLFHVAGGLQILPPGKDNVSENWQYIRPEPGHVLVNLGDTIVEWTGGMLRSSLHRVVTAPGAQATLPRQSLAYLIRPERNASMHRLTGGTVIPLLKEGEEDETRSVTEWAAWRAQQIMNGALKPQTRGGKHVETH